MNICLTQNYKRTPERPNFLIFQRAGQGKYPLATGDDPDLFNFLIKPEWEATFAALYAQERAIIEQRRQLMEQYRAELTAEIAANHPHLLI